MKECIYRTGFGGKLIRLLCCHVWQNQKIYTNAKITIEKNKCIDCGRTEILILVDWI